MYNSEEKMQHIMQEPQLTPDAKMKLYDETLERFLTFQSQLKNQLLVQNNLQATPKLSETPPNTQFYVQNTFPTSLPWCLLHLMKPIF